ncbi:hypothetical protein QBC32DRAFT_368315 [Pseudoneurospora amorphoporcata]|uniref:Uncharacterized protein n=1 Tax=Pseudoneurospora amorphoporcata TaxID=241081 RepID=A0AAN6P3B6_9PEZI|nr:hypothetical protein QBC32DRAFT_368315 [Pseudoneurospora amorphoporcata]
MDQVALLRLCYLPMVERFPRIRMFGSWFSVTSLPSFTRDIPCRPYGHIPPIAIHDSKSDRPTPHRPGSLSALSSDPLAPLVVLRSALVINSQTPHLFTVSFLQKNNTS